MELGLKEKIVIVTGGGSGIGASDSNDTNYYLRKLNKNNKQLLWKNIVLLPWILVAWYS